jgi:pimeloyl-ACP methyl ester carboxylesterase
MRIEIEPGVRVFVDIEGAGHVPDGPRLREKPTLVLIHGGPGFDHTGFRPFFSRLSDIAQVVYYDQRGHGRSDVRPPAEWTLDTFADDVVRLCDALGIVKPIVLGQSFGGFVAQRYIARHPAHPAKVILSSTAARYNLAGKVAGFGRRGGPEAAEATRSFWSNPSPETWPPYDRACRALYNHPPRPRRQAAPAVPARDPVRQRRRRAAPHGPAARPGPHPVPGVGDGGRRRPRHAA